MATRDELKISVCAAIDEAADEIIAIGDAILSQPEMGFKEYKTAALAAQVMASRDVAYRTGLAVTGVRGDIQGRGPGPSLGILGELDAVRVDEHPMADKKTGAAHACGHNGQIAAMLGAMIGLKACRIEDHISGNLVFFAVPAEELVEIDYRMGLIESGKIGLPAGKQELIRMGCFTDIHMAMMVHGHTRKDSEKVILGTSSNGCIVKRVRFIGKAAHAGNAPHHGINALNAAQIALSAIHAQRETFRDRDAVRIHPIITKGGSLVNVVPSEVCLETFIRGRTNAVIADAEKKVDRALKAGAAAVGAGVEIQTIPGYMPLINNSGLAEVFKRNAFSLLGENEFAQVGHGAGSTDMGDISHLMPALHPAVGGITGTGHGADFAIMDKELVYVTAAKLLAMTAIDLFFGNAETALNIIRRFTPEMTIDAYLDYQKRLFATRFFDGNI
ncbi:MAG: amidohydrolase [Desulfobacterales bacterium]